MKFSSADLKTFIQEKNEYLIKDVFTSITMKKIYIFNK